MTDAVFLALIALTGSILFATVVIVLVVAVLKSKPSSFKFFWTKYGHFEVSFKNWQDE